MAPYIMAYVMRLQGHFAAACGQAAGGRNQRDSIPDRNHTHREVVVGLRVHAPWRLSAGAFRPGGAGASSGGPGLSLGLGLVPGTGRAPVPPGSSNLVSAAGLTSEAELALADVTFDSAQDCLGRAFGRAAEEVAASDCFFRDSGSTAVVCMVLPDRYASRACSPEDFKLAKPLCAMCWVGVCMVVVHMVLPDRAGIKATTRGPSAPLFPQAPSASACPPTPPPRSPLPEPLETSSCPT
jgi:hypothetical protein